MAQKKESDFSEAYLVLEKIDKRITSLEKDAAFIELKANSISNKKKENYNAINNEMKNIKKDISETREKMKVCMHEMIKLSDELKSTIKNEQLSLLSEKIDEIKFEEYVTKNNLKKPLSKI